MSPVSNQNKNKRNRFTWWELALAAIVLSAISRLASEKSSKNSRAFYTNKMKQAPWAPPGWVFGPAWMINNYFLLRALVKIFELKHGKKRTILLSIQFLIWVIFFSFNFVYFRKKSPILAAVWTRADALLATISLFIALKSKFDFAKDYIPLVIWTNYASTIADYQAIYNSDPVFKSKPLIRYISRS